MRARLLEKYPTILQSSPSILNDTEICTMLAYNDIPAL